jgi:hypothetical protein
VFSLPKLHTLTVTRAPQPPYAPALGTTYYTLCTLRCRYSIFLSLQPPFGLASTQLTSNVTLPNSINATQRNITSSSFLNPPAVALAYFQKETQRTRCKGCETPKVTAPVPIRAGAYSLLNSRSAWKRSAWHPSIPSISALLRLLSDCISVSCEQRAKRGREGLSVRRRL